MAGIIGRIFGFLGGNGAKTLGDAVTDTAEVFTVNKTKQALFEHEEYNEALRQYTAEFNTGNRNWFDSLVNGLNRLPRPLIALGTVALFVYAMNDPAAFAIRMQALDLVPDELWWLLGAVVSFYFGARELHYIRKDKKQSRVTPEKVAVVIDSIKQLQDLKTSALTPGAARASDPDDRLEIGNKTSTDDNPALAAMLNAGGE